MKKLTSIAVLVFGISCGGGDSTLITPTPVVSTAGTTTPVIPAPAQPAPAIPTTYTLSGKITDGTSHGVLPNIHIDVTDGPNAGRSVLTDGAGNYSLATLQAGSYGVRFSATSYVAQTWTGTLGGNYQLDIVLQRVMAPPPTPPPAAPNPSPSPTPSPQPSPGPSTTVLYVWGGPNYSVFLGTFSCVFCTEYGLDSINNQYGDYGSPYALRSMRNRYGDYGSPYAIYSACNPYTSTPPRVFNAARSGTYGLLTLNPYVSGAIADAIIVGWLKGYVCN